MTPYGDKIWVKIGSGSGLLPDGTKPLPEPMLTYRKWGPVTNIWRQFHKRYIPQSWMIEVSLKITNPKFHSNPPGANELKGVTDTHRTIRLRQQAIRWTCKQWYKSVILHMKQTTFLVCKDCQIGLIHKSGKGHQDLALSMFVNPIQFYKIGSSFKIIPQNVVVLQLDCPSKLESSIWYGTYLGLNISFRHRVWGHVKI